MRQVLRITRTTFYRIITGLFAIILVILVIPVFLLLFLPSCLIRCIVSKMAKRFKPNLGKMLASGSTLHAQDDIRATVIAPSLVQGSPNVEQIREQTQIKLLDQLSSSIGPLKYPELQQNITSWFGFQFWTPVKNFRIEDHVYYLDNKLTGTTGDFELDGKDGELLIKYLSEKPWPKDKALWEVIIIPNVTTTSSTPGDKCGLIVLRIHHSLSDSSAMFLLLDNVSSPRIKDIILKPRCPPDLKKSHLFMDSKLGKGIKALIFLLKIPYDLAQGLLSLKGGDPLRSGGVKVQNHLTSNTSRSILNSEIKSVATQHGVSFSAVVMAMIAKGIRETAISRFGKVDQDVSLHYPVGLTAHPDKLRNYATMGFIRLPLVESNPRERLKLIHEEFEGTRRSIFPRIMFIVSTILGCQFSFALKYLLIGAKSQPAVGLTNIAWSPIPTKLFGYPLKEPFLSVGVRGTRVLMFGYISMAGSGRLWVNSDASLLATRDDADSLLAECMKELEILKGLNFDNKGFEMV